MILSGCRSSHRERVRIIEQKNQIVEEETIEKESVRQFVSLPVYTETGDLMISHKAYDLSFSKEWKLARWVQYVLTAEHTTGNVKRDSRFYEDPKLDRNLRIYSNEFKGTGWTRGHLAPAGDFKWDETAMMESCYMTNICPQAGNLNGRYWERIERKCREWAKKEGVVTIVTGPIITSKNPERIGPHSVALPESFFKCVLSLKKGHEKCIAFIYLNIESPQRMEDCIKTVDEVELITGLDLFSSLPDDVENRIESISNLNNWP